jgi:hypothetical protein
MYGEDTMVTPVQSLAAAIKKWPRLQALLQILKVHQPLFLEYPVNPQPRYGYGTPPHPLLYEIINRHRASYAQKLNQFLLFTPNFLTIPVTTAAPEEPCWINKWLSALDSVALYSFLCLNNPLHYLEIGSGWSTKFAKRAIKDYDLQTAITSIDPSPRTEIGPLCDTIIREPVENVDLALFDQLTSGDILYIDSSHRCFMNSDVTTVFLDIFPRLKKGVLVEFHDIFLPYDYPPAWKKRYYSEQYLLAVGILAESTFSIVLPNTFISNDAALRTLMDPLWNELHMEKVKRKGNSFWIQTK